MRAKIRLMASRSVERVTLALERGPDSTSRWAQTRRDLSRIDGVRSVFLNPVTDMAYVEYDRRLADASQIVAAVEGMGLRVTELQKR